MKPRKPNQQELEDLANYVETLYWYEVDDPEATVAKAVETAAIAVFDDYRADNTAGYSGKLMTVIWSAGPEYYQVFIWRDGELTHIEQNDHFKE